MENSDRVPLVCVQKPSTSSQKYGSIQKIDETTSRRSISWHNITVTTKQTSFVKHLKRFSKQSEEILNDVSGEAESGKLLAIMASSGAGKTTLMNVLAQRNISHLNLEGTVKLNGQPVDKDAIRAVSAYVQQDDLFISTLTVREHLLFQSKLRMDPSLNRKERKARVDKILLDLGLTGCANAYIDDPGKGISGGQRKRLSFASELLTDPAIMFCDEPTSGLDSFMALNVVQVLRNMAESDRTVICTIHQPSSEVFALFSHLLLMADKRVAYLGEAGEAKEFFSTFGYSSPNNYNPSDFYIKQLSVDPNKKDESIGRINLICDGYRQKCDEKQYEPNTSKTNTASTSTQCLPVNHNNGRVYRSGWCTQFRVLFCRSFRTTYRDPEFPYVSIFLILMTFITIIIAILMGLIYFQLDLNQKGIPNINGALWMLLMYLSLQSLFGSVNTFCKEVPIFHREHSNNVYRVSPYFLTKMLAELPIYVIIPSIFVLTIYFMVGLNNNIYRLLICICICILIANVASSFGYLMALLTYNISSALMLSTPLLIPLLTFGGLFNNIESIPSYLIWIKYISWFYYGYESLVINQWDGVDNIDYSDQLCECSRLLSGDQVIQSMDFSVDHFWRNIGIMFALTVCLRVMTYLLLLYKSLDDGLIVELKAKFKAIITVCKRH
ncbi:protein white-like [Oppia nitens]|uniref:protein white-like n=1 Tax=Oppia nitens TaxID=1686743 RepID=UPI0023D9ACF3|nr:protein white-like [Oppia nitens]